MSRDRFDASCPGCRPVMLDVKTGQPLADDSIEMTIVRGLWEETTFKERQAWHRFTCQNSRVAGDLRLARAFTDRVQAALTAASSERSS